MKHYYIATVKYKRGAEVFGVASVSLDTSTPNAHEVQKKILELAERCNAGGFSVEITGVFKTGEE